MHFQTAASIAILACASHVAAEASPYKPVMKAVSGLSLARRDVPGYQPEQTVCGKGNTCAEACGQGFDMCPSGNESVHCFNPAAKQTCCKDGTGNSCDEGYYCTHDTKNETMCCPESMSLSECAAAYSVTGGLKTAEPTTSTVAPSTSSSPTPTSIKVTSTEVTSTEVKTTETPSSTPSPTVPSSTSTTPVVVVAKTTSQKEKTTIAAPSAAYTTAWAGSNSTIASTVPTQPVEPVQPAPEPSSTGVAPVPTSGAAATGFSALVFAIAGAIALI